jgi:hypothetical protein
LRFFFFFFCCPPFSFFFAQQDSPNPYSHSFPLDFHFTYDLHVTSWFPRFGLIRVCKPIDSVLYRQQIQQNSQRDCLLVSHLFFFRCPLFRQSYLRLHSNKCIFSSRYFSPFFSSSSFISLKPIQVFFCKLDRPSILHGPVLCRVKNKFPRPSNTISCYSLLTKKS